MFEMPTHKNIIKQVIVDADAITRRGRPQIVIEGDTQLQWREDGTLESAA